MTSEPQTADAGNDTACAAHMITFLPAGATVHCSDGQTVLEAALTAGFFPKHSCRRGECNACAAHIVSGVIRYPDGFTPSPLPKGHCLTCMATPITPLTIESPEVSATPGRRLVQAGARVTTVQHVSHDVTVVRLQVPPGANFDFKPGQYVDVLLREGARRSYSMANTPDGTGQIEWHVRAMVNGRFSNYVYQTLKVRDLLRIEGPFGAFALSSEDRPVILLASGTGYAPIASILKSHHNELAERGATLYWGGRRREDLYAFEEAQAWAASSERFRFIPVLSEPDTSWDGQSGFVHETVAADHSDLSEHEVYACGNPLMVDAARTVFCTDHGLPAGNFFSDAFLTSPTVKGRRVSSTVSTV